MLLLSIAFIQRYFPLSSRLTALAWVTSFFYSAFLNIHQSVYLQRWHGWCQVKLLLSRRVLCTPYKHAPCHFMWNGYRNKSQHRNLTLENKILPPFLPGLEPATFQSWVPRSNHGMSVILLKIQWHPLAHTQIHALHSPERERERALKRQVIPICGAVNAGPAYCAHQHQLTSANSPHNKPVMVIGSMEVGFCFVLVFSTESRIRDLLRITMQRHHLSILLHLSAVILANATVLSFVLLRNSRLFHC